MNDTSPVSSLPSRGSDNAEDAAFIFDNTSAHYRASCTEDILHGAQIIWMLPPYSPILNIVEQAISTHKASLKRALEEARPNLLSIPHDERMVIIAGLAESHVSSIAPDMAPRWFTKSQGYVLACLNMDDILM